MSKVNKTWTYTYDANGMRTKRSDGYAQGTYTYVYNGSKLAQMTAEGYILNFAYDASGTPLSFTMDGSLYFYETNLQGDVIGIIDPSGNSVVRYAYDAWGKVQIVNNHQIAMLNPLLYRGYVYDWETGLYYLQSRYYNPEWGRFINGDGLVSTGQGFVGNNMFAYCCNNPIMFKDHLGSSATLTLTFCAVSISFSQLVQAVAITVVAVAAIVLVAEVVIPLAVEVVEDAFSVNDSPSVVYDVADATLNTPSPEDNGDDDDDDDDFDDDYYDDDDNFGGRQKIGKPKGSTPGNNRAQNEQFRNATRGLKPSEQSYLHYQNSKQGFGYQEILAQAKSLLQLKNP